jgi:hypothetical protein
VFKLRVVGVCTASAALVSLCLRVGILSFFGRHRWKTPLPAKLSCGVGVAAALLLLTACGVAQWGEERRRVETFIRASLDELQKGNTPKVDLYLYRWGAYTGAANILAKLEDLKGNVPSNYRLRVGSNDYGNCSCLVYFPDGRSYSFRISLLNNDCSILGVGILSRSKGLQRVADCFDGGGDGSNQPSEKYREAEQKTRDFVQQSLVQLHDGKMPEVESLAVGRSLTLSVLEGLKGSVPEGNLPLRDYQLILYNVPNPCEQYNYSVEFSDKSAYAFAVCISESSCQIRKAAKLRNSDGTVPGNSGHPPMHLKR